MIFTSERTAMLPLLQAAVSTTVELILQSMTVYTPSMLEKIPKSATSKDTMEKAMDGVRTL